MINNEQKPVKNRLFKIIANILTIIVVIFAATSLTFVLYTKANNKETLNLFGVETRLVITGSMEPSEEFDTSSYEIKSISKGDAVVINTTIDFSGTNEEYIEYNQWISNNLEVGDIVTFLKDNVCITHRLINMQSREDGYVLEFQGDYREKGQTPLTQVVRTYKSAGYRPGDKVIGKVTKVSRPLGNILAFAYNKFLVYLLIVVPCVCVIVYHAIFLIKYTSKLKNKQESEGN